MINCRYRHDAVYGRKQTVSIGRITRGLCEARRESNKSSYKLLAAVVHGVPRRSTNYKQILSPGGEGEERLIRIRPKPRTDANLYARYKPRTWARLWKND